MTTDFANQTAIMPLARRLIYGFLCLLPMGGMAIFVGWALFLAWLFTAPHPWVTSVALPWVGVSLIVHAMAVAILYAYQKYAWAVFISWLLPILLLGAKIVKGFWYWG